MKSFISEHYSALLRRHGLDTFEAFWDLPRDWVEDANVRRTGWSGAIRHTLTDRDGHRLSMFVKLQENHNYRSPTHLLQWRPTFYRDFLNIRRMERIGMSTAEPVFYAEHRDGDKLQAVLVTLALEGYRELNSVFRDPSVGSETRLAILHRIAETIWRLHCRRFQHNGLSGRHVMINLKSDHTFDIRILDLEKMRRSWSWFRTAVCDLEKFIVLTFLTPAEQSELVHHYSRQLSPAHRTKLIHMINTRIAERWPGRAPNIPVTHLNGSCETFKKTGDRGPATWHFLIPAFLGFSSMINAYSRNKKKERKTDDPVRDAGKSHGSLHETFSLKPGCSCGRAGKTREKE
jgi:hypothetical protein